MLADCSHRAALATSQGGVCWPTPATARLNQEDVSTPVLEGTPLTVEAVADFLELPASPERSGWAARALAYATTLDEPLDRIAGLMLARAWLAITPPARLPKPAGRLRLHAVVTH